MRRTNTSVKMSSSDFDFGLVSGYRLSPLGLPDCILTTAAASCRIDFMGWQKGMHNGQAPRCQKWSSHSGRWGHIKLGTHGAVPVSACRWQRGASYVTADNFGAIDEVLGCFGLEFEGVLNWATSGAGLGADDRLTFSLREIIEGMRPELIETDRVIASSDNAEEAREEVLRFDSVC